jgi:hypothetical protein
LDPKSRGAEMFARYAHAPNALGYCGPPLGATLRDGSVDEVRRAATKFSGAWPYLRVLSVGLPACRVVLAGRRRRRQP